MLTKIAVIALFLFSNIAHAAGAFRPPIGAPLNTCRGCHTSTGNTAGEEAWPMGTQGAIDLVTYAQVSEDILNARMTTEEALTRYHTVRTQNLMARCRPSSLTPCALGGTSNHPYKYYPSTLPMY